MLGLLALSPGLVLINQGRAADALSHAKQAADGRVAAIEFKTGQTAKPDWFRAATAAGGD